MTRKEQHKARKRRVKGHYIYDFFVPLTKHIFKMQRTNTEAEEIVTKLNSIKQSKEVPLC